MLLTLLLLLQAAASQTDPTANPDMVGLLRFFAGFGLILLLYTGALLFTYWISKDE
jgi:hypothetical protein